jgi:NADPH:quinone reductase-like Zn-dependent oxidoreductase
MIMRAMVMEEFGSADVLKLQDVQSPEIADGEILVEAKAIGVNPIDYVARTVGGPLRPIVEAALSNQTPVILGWDIAGIVTESKSSAFNPGDKVFALARFPALTGGYAEFVAIPANEAVLIPGNLNFEEAAAVPLAALTAWQSLVETAGIKPGMRVLIHAAAGGVGHFAVQFVKLKGAKVICSASAHNFDFLKELGADEIVDYNERNVGEIVSDVDVVLHALPPEMRGDVSWPCLKAGGLLISLKGPVPEEESESHNAKGIGIGVRPEKAQLTEIAGLLETGAVKVLVSKTFALEDVGAAHKQLETGHTRGKIVLTV